MPYGEALRLQLDLCERRQADAVENTVLLVEHPPVITLGARKTENRLLSDSRHLEGLGIEVVAVGRGGGTTAHNPGQIVVYPIVKLKSLGLGITEYVRQLEAIGIELLAEYGITAGCRKGYPGLWVGEKKIGSIGVQVKKWVTMHGMAINICNDLGIFDHIVPCGLDGVCMTSVATLAGGTWAWPMSGRGWRGCVPWRFRVKGGSGMGVAAMVAGGRPMSRTRAGWPYHGGCMSVERRLPAWLKRRVGAGEVFAHTTRAVSELGLETICTNANCPNRGECWGRGTATVLILGNVCTRNCRFCAVATGRPLPPDADEPRRVAALARELALKYLVITSVDRDDLPDGGAAHFRNVIARCRREVDAPPV